MNFTAAHELGHVVLHPPMKQHRDRPVDGEGDYVRRSQIEEEADRFAVCFSMPRKKVSSEFMMRFLTDQFELNDATAFALYRTSLFDVRSQWWSLRAGARELARATQFDGRPFASLSERFGVSIEAMAIRLEELDLLAPNAMWTQFHSMENR